jgi:hypothetical protein
LRSLHGCSLNQRSVEFSFFVHYALLARLTFKQSTKREELQWSLWEKEKRGIIAGERDQWPGLAHARPVSLSAFQATLNSNELVLEFSLGEPQSTVLEIERESISAHRIAGGERLKTLVESYRADVFGRRLGLAPVERAL